MATGRVLYFKPVRGYPGSYIGAIVDNAIGRAHRSTDVHFDNRDLPEDVDMTLVGIGDRVEFSYTPAMDSRGRMRAERVVLLDDLKAFEQGTVRFISPPDVAGHFYGFIDPDVRGAGVYFNDHMIQGEASAIAKGSRVAFRRSPNASKPRAAMVKEIA